MPSMVEFAREFGVYVVQTPWLAGGVVAAWVPEHRNLMVLDTLDGPGLDDVVAQAIDRVALGAPRP